MKFRLFLFLSVSLLAFGCNKSDTAQAEDDDELLQAYITENNLDAAKTASGLYYVVDTIGNGASPVATSCVSVIYTGYKTDGTIFDTSGQVAVTFRVNQLIQGFAEGLQLFKAGGKGTLLIPSGLGYGDSWAGNLSPNTNLLFDIELVEVLDENACS